MIDFKEELDKLSQPPIDPQFAQYSEDVSTTLQALNGITARLFKKQGAMSMQVEEIYSILEEKDNTDLIKNLEQENQNLLDTLVTASDLLEDFYLYYKEYPDEAMTAQSELMWNTICKAMAGIGLLRIADENTPFDPKLNSIEGVVEDPSFRNGFIVKVLKSGYRYQTNVYRKSIVIVNRAEEVESE